MSFFTGLTNFWAKRRRTKAVPTVLRLPALSLRRGLSFVQAELKGNPKNSGNRSQSRSLQRDQVQEPAKDGGCGIHSFPFPCGPSIRTPKHWRFPTGGRELRRQCARAMLQCPWTRSAGAAGDPGKLAETPGQGTDTYISSLAGYLEALADKLASSRYFHRPQNTKSGSSSSSCHSLRLEPRPG
jgi:hypothetical protein